MRLSLLLGIAVSAGLSIAPAYAQRAAQQGSVAGPRTTRPSTAPEMGVQTVSNGAPVLNSAQPAPLQLRNGAVPTGLHGFYDYQSNGVLHGRTYVSPTDPNKIYTVYMLSLDGTDTTTLTNSRRVGYAFSTDGGSTWQATQEIQPGFRLGFPCLDVAADGTPYIATHGDPDGQGVRTLMYTGVAGATTFTKTGTYERLSFTGREGDDGAGVIWPSMVISPTDPTKDVVVATLSPKTKPTAELDDPVHFSAAPVGKAGPWDIISDVNVSTSGGGRNVLAKSAGGKIGLAYYHFGGGDSSGIYYSQTTNNGGSWTTPVKVLSNSTTSNGDSVITDATYDMTFNGEEPQIVSSGFIKPSGVDGLLFINEAIVFWSPSKGTHVVAHADSSKFLGVVNVPATTGGLTPKDQPSYPEMAYPTISVGDDGQHLVVVFSAAAQAPTDDENSGDRVVSEDGFFYHRLWAVGSPDGGATWSDPKIVQDYGGEGTDSASIEYPVAGPTAHVKDNNMDVALTYQARRFPGMYAFVVADVDTSTEVTPADRGPINETFQYFQKLSFDPTFFGQPASVNTNTTASGAMEFLRSFPNPASGSFSVTYRLATQGDVSIKIYNMLGAEVLSPVTADVSFPGEYNRALDVSGLTAGAYRVVLSENGRSISQPLTIVR